MSEMDEIFRKQLQHREEQVPDGLWAGIEQQLQESPKRRLLPWYITAAIVAVGILVALWVGSATSGEPQPVGGVLDDVASATIQEQYAAESSNSSPDAPRDLADVSSRSIKSQGAREANPVSQDIDRNTSVHLGESSSASVIVDKTTASSLVDPTTTTYGDQTTKEQTLARAVLDESSDKTTSESQEVQAAQRYSQDSEKRSRKQDTMIETRTSGSSRVTKPLSNGATRDIQWVIEQTDNVTVNTIAAPEMMKSKVFNRRREIFRSPEELPTIIDLNTIDLDSDYEESVKARATAAYTECPSFSKDNSGLFADVYMSHISPLRSLDGRMASDQQLLDLREKSESVAYSYGFGGRLSIRMPSGWSFRTGLHYTQINEALSFVGVDDQQYEMDNRYSMFDLPLLIGKDFGIDGSRVYFSVNGGAFLNMTFSQDATILNEEGMPVPANDAADEQRSAYRDNAGVSWYAGAAIYYRLARGMDVFAEPYLRYMPSNLTSDRYSLTQRYTLVGVNTGVRFRF